MDLRTPIAYLFTVLGVILGGWGLIGDANTKAGDNINLWWGVALLVFGLAMGAGAIRAAKCDAKKDGDADKKSCGTGCGCK